MAVRVLFLVFLLTKDLLACQMGWHYSEGRCIYFSRFTANFEGALSICKLYGGQLIEINNHSMYVSIKRMARHRGKFQLMKDFDIDIRFWPGRVELVEQKQRHVTCIEWYWIGLSDMFGEGVWMTATSLKKQIYTRWGPGEPNNYYGVEHCAEALSFGRYWNDVPCSHITYFVCEKKDNN